MNTKKASSKRNRPKEGFLIHDVITGKDIFIPLHGVMKFAQEYGFNFTNVSKLRTGACSHIIGRFILPDNKHKLFTLFDVDTGECFNCVNNKTIFIHFNSEYNGNDAKYIYELKSGRQKAASIQGRVLMLKGGVKGDRYKTMKAESDFIDLKRNEAGIRRNVKNTIHSRILKALFDSSVKKTDSFVELTGRTPEKLRAYIQSKFTKNMSWSNRSDWSIDHIIPCNSFDLTKKEDQLKCFNYTNLQPIWSTSDIAKSYGESDWYLGNKNKNSNKEHCFDYAMVSVTMKNHSDIIAEDQAIYLAKEIFKKGYRKVDNSNDIPMQDGSL